MSSHDAVDFNANRCGIHAYEFSAIMCYQTFLPLLSRWAEIYIIRRLLSVNASNVSFVFTNYDLINVSLTNMDLDLYWY